MDVKQIEFLRVTAGRIASVREMSRAGVSETDLRNLSTVLRELIPTGLHDAWRLCGMESPVAVITSERLAPGLELPKFAYLGGAADTDGPTYSQGGRDWEYSFGMPMPHVVTLNEHGEEFIQPGGVLRSFEMRDDLADLSSSGRQAFEHHVFRLHEYADGTVIVTEGLRISRRQLITYVSNTRGGNHWDPSGKKQDTARFTALEALSSNATVSGRDPTFYALMTIGQEIGTAPDVIFLEKRIQQLTPPIAGRR